jgi:hypothetical protein
VELIVVELRSVAADLDLVDAGESEIPFHGHGAGGIAGGDAPREIERPLHEALARQTG